MKNKDSYKINYRTLSNGKHDIHFHIDPQMFTSVDDGEIHGGECNVNIHLTKGLSSLRLEIAIEGDVTVSCDRCLEDVSVPVRFDGVLIVNITSEVQSSEFVIDDKSEDTLLINPMIEELDLEEYLYDSLILSLPIQRVHEEDDEGVSLCNPDMLSRFSIADEDWDLDEDDDEEEDEDDDNL